MPNVPNVAYARFIPNNEQTKAKIGDDAISNPPVIIPAIEGRCPFLIKPHSSTLG